MWIWRLDGKGLVNTANVVSLDTVEIADVTYAPDSWEHTVVGTGVYEIRAFDTKCDYTPIFQGTEKECKKYLLQLDEDLAEQGDRVAVALEAIRIELEAVFELHFIETARRVDQITP